MESPEITRGAKDLEIVDMEHSTGKTMTQAIARGLQARIEQPVRQ
jgi:hypothetical protein